MADETHGAPNPTTQQPGPAPLSLVAQIVNQARMAPDVSQVDHAGELIAAFAKEVQATNIVVNEKTDLIKALKDRIAAIDQILSDQVNEVMHYKDSDGNKTFQNLEATWRGLHYLVSKSETGEFLKIRVMNMSWKDLVNDMDKAIDFDQSVVFKKIYEEEYGTFGGNPFSCLIGDFEFGRHPQHVSTLKKFAGVAAAAHAPFIAGAHPKLFDMTSYQELDKPRDMRKIFESTELSDWAEFRKMEDSRYVTLTLPHFMLRLPYGPDTVPVEGFDFREDMDDGMSQDKYLWGNAAFALGQRITAAFAKYHWCAAIRGVEGGGLVEDLPQHVYENPKSFKNGKGEVVPGVKLLQVPTELAITDRREKELSDLGFIALCHKKGSPLAAFFGGQTANKPLTYLNPKASQNAAISAMLPYMLASSRFAHYIKSIMRDKIGSFMTKDNVATYLNQWISQYVLLNDDAPQEVKAKFPLREARVEVSETPNRPPGCYTAVVFLRPHFQLDELSVSLRLVAELPAPAK
jgi:type VI secretion system protein ImpC